MTRSPRKSRSSRGMRARRRRRRLVGFVIVVLVVGVAIAANRGPVTDYLHARARAEQKAVAVASREQELTQSKKELSRLGTDDSMEVTAREELVYARPEEDVFIVNAEDGGSGTTLEPTSPGEARDDCGGDSTKAGVGTESEQPGTPGPIERFVRAVLGIFR